MAQWINLNQNYRFMLAHQLSVLGEKTGPILLPLTGIMAGRKEGRDRDRPPDKMWVGFEIFKILHRLNYLCFYFVCYHNNVTTV